MSGVGRLVTFINMYTLCSNHFREELDDCALVGLVWTPPRPKKKIFWLRPCRLLKHLQLSDVLYNGISFCYKKCTSRLIVNLTLSNILELISSVRQGCPLSPLLGAIHLMFKCASSSREYRYDSVMQMALPILSSRYQLRHRTTMPPLTRTNYGRLDLKYQISWLLNIVRNDIGFYAPVSSNMLKCFSYTLR